MPLTGAHSGLTWYVRDTATQAGGAPFYFGYLPSTATGRPTDYELHRYALVDAAGAYHPDRPYDPAAGSYGAYLNERASWLNQAGLRSTYDLRIHGDWAAFFAMLQATDAQIAGHQRDGWPARVGAHVGPQPAELVDGTAPGLGPAPAPAYSPAEQQQLRQGLDATDLGYPDTAAAEWL